MDGMDMIWWSNNARHSQYDMCVSRCLTQRSRILVRNQFQLFIWSACYTLLVCAHLHGGWMEACTFSALLGDDSKRWHCAVAQAGDNWKAEFCRYSMFKYILYLCVYIKTVYKCIQYNSMYGFVLRSNTPEEQIVHCTINSTVKTLKYFKCLFLRHAMWQLLLPIMDMDGQTAEL